MFERRKLDHSIDKTDVKRLSFNERFLETA